MESDGSPETTDLRLRGQLILRVGDCCGPEAKNLPLRVLHPSAFSGFLRKGRKADDYLPSLDVKLRRRVRTEAYLAADPLICSDVVEEVSEGFKGTRPTADCD